MDLCSKGMLLILVTALLASSVSAHQCNIEQGKEPNYEDYSCESYWDCHDYTGILKRCQGDEQFDFKMAECQANKKVWCQWQHLKLQEGNGKSDKEGTVVASSSTNPKVLHVHHLLKNKRVKTYNPNVQVVSVISHDHSHPHEDGTRHSHPHTHPVVEQQPHTPHEHSDENESDEHEHPHEHDDGTSHSHPHSHYDGDDSGTKVYYYYEPDYSDGTGHSNPDESFTHTHDSSAHTHYVDADGQISYNVYDTYSDNQSPSHSDNQSPSYSDNQSPSYTDENHSSSYEYPEHYAEYPDHSHNTKANDLGMEYDVTDGGSDKNHDYYYYSDVDKWNYICMSKYGHEPNHEDMKCKSFWRCDDYKGSKIYCSPGQLYDYHAKACRDKVHVDCHGQLQGQRGQGHRTRVEKKDSGLTIVHHFYHEGAQPSTGNSGSVTYEYQDYHVEHAKGDDDIIDDVSVIFPQSSSGSKTITTVSRKKRHALESKKLSLRPPVTGLDKFLTLGILVDATKQRNQNRFMKSTQAAENDIAVNVLKVIGYDHVHDDGRYHTHSHPEGEDVDGHSHEHTHLDGTTHSHPHTHGHGDEEIDGHEHEHTHDDGVTHSHPHSHTDESVLDGHSHEHTHADGTRHSHPHSHTDDHDHSHDDNDDDINVDMTSDGHAHEHTHKDGTRHSHPHNHTDDHEHPHNDNDGHTHEHAHADGTRHSHPHSHTGDHIHPHKSANLVSLGLYEEDQTPVKSTTPTELDNDNTNTHTTENDTHIHSSIHTNTNGSSNFQDTQSHNDTGNSTHSHTNSDDKNGTSHSPTHTHSDGTVHSHPHNHTGNHTHSHNRNTTNGVHSHEHTHADGRQHSHPHKHRGSHVHPHVQVINLRDQSGTNFQRTSSNLRALRHPRLRRLRKLLTSNNKS